ncbi:MAG: hypothetical protein ACI9MC_000619 [Kiritimatiellia bacterium]|jgi:hypothetical protein
MTPLAWAPLWSPGRSHAHIGHAAHSTLEAAILRIGTHPPSPPQAPPRQVPRSRSRS